MKSIILKTAIASVSLILLGTAAQADKFGFKYAEGDSCSSSYTSPFKGKKMKHKTVKYKATKHKKMKRTAWGAAAKPAQRQVWGSQNSR